MLEQLVVSGISMSSKYTSSCWMMRYARQVRVRYEIQAHQGNGLNNLLIQKLPSRSLATFPFLTSPSQVPYSTLILNLFSPQTSSLSL